MANISFGVPRASVLGIYFCFCIYINKLYKSTNPIQFVNFADDTKVFASDGVIYNGHDTVIGKLLGVDNLFKTNRGDSNRGGDSFASFLQK